MQLNEGFEGFARSAPPALHNGSRGKGVGIRGKGVGSRGKVVILARPCP